jgi:hypothetical protein
MEDGRSDPLQPVPDPIGVRVLVLALTLAGFAYLLGRLIRTWEQWPEDASSARLRIGELAFVGAFVVWALGRVLSSPPPATGDAGSPRDESAGRG